MPIVGAICPLRGDISAPIRHRIPNTDPGCDSPEPPRARYFKGGRRASCRKQRLLALRPPLLPIADTTDRNRHKKKGVSEPSAGRPAVAARASDPPHIHALRRNHPCPTHYVP